MPPPEATQRITLDYLQDTLFGVNALSAECTVRQSCLPPHADTALLCLLVLPPWPATLQQAHAVTFDWRGRSYHGRVRRTRRLACGELQLEIAPEPPHPAS
ncbi:hypothetical protein [Pseudomonas chlororaphis]|uniref:hypothetical protein n=1 Tax=Pseudomonas chlororaphis TaxID=587753 RepID=UPI0005F8996A|nr:hypothetical protein [Pseudomonas chlororaphis]